MVWHIDVLLDLGALQWTFGQVFVLATVTSSLVPGPLSEKLTLTLTLTLLDFSERGLGTRLGHISKRKA